MRKSFLLFLLCHCSLLSAQNWALINPDYKYNYSNDGTDTISNQIFVTQVDTLGVDSVVYKMNSVGELCDTCGSTYTSNCMDVQSSDGALRLHIPQFLGGLVTRAGTWWSLGGSGGIQVNTSATTGTNWLCANGSSGTVLGADTATVLGLADSIKWVGYSNGDTILFGKGTGLLQASIISENSGHHALIGIAGGAIVGEQLPTVFTTFDYQPNDVLQYLVTGNWSSGSSAVYLINGHLKYEFLGRTTYQDSIVYLVQLITSLHQTCLGAPPSTPGCSIWTRTTELLNFSITNDPHSGINPFNPYWEMPFWPGGVGRVAYPYDWYGNNHAFTSFRKDDQGRYFIEQVGFQEDSYNSTLYCTTVQDSSIALHNQAVTFGSSFADGIGLIKENLYYFEGGQDRTLEGSLLNGDLIGNISSDGLLLSTGPDLQLPSFLIKPNPASEFLFIEGLQPDEIISILDITGRTILSYVAHATEAQITITALPAGVYLLQCGTGMALQSFVVAR
ncbi:MAG: T9SS type A sorting domain-containing protein [Flavobacteriales bacterium]